MEVDTLRLLAQPKEGQQQFKNKKQPELTEYRTTRKSNNQGDKEETFSQTVGGAETGSQDRRDSWRQLADSAAPHSHIDNREERQGVKWTAQPRAPARGNKASNL